MDEFGVMVSLCHGNDIWDLGELSYHEAREYIKLIDEHNVGVHGRVMKLDRTDYSVKVAGDAVTEEVLEIWLSEV